MSFYECFGQYFGRLVLKISQERNFSPIRNGPIALTMLDHWLGAVRAQEVDWSFFMAIVTYPLPHREKSIQEGLVCGVASLWFLLACLSKQQFLEYRIW